MIFSFGYVYGQFKATNPKIVYGVRYMKEHGDCTIITNSTDEGYYYPTRKAALEAGYSAIQSDKEVGYTVYPSTVEAFETIEPKDD